MTHRNELVRDAFQDDVLGSTDRDRLWSTMQHHHARQARRRILARAGAMLLAGAIIVALWAFLRVGVSANQRLADVAVAADSLGNNIPPELSMIQEPKEAVSSNLMPLLQHRSALRIDVNNAEMRRDALVARLEQTTGAEHDRIERELAAVEQQLEASRVAINIIDRQLMGHETPVVTHAIADAPQIFQFGSPGIPAEVIWAAGGASGLLLLGMLSLFVYMRRVARSTREALGLIEGQVSSQHATLASGIDAIAVEVERLGEGQRFMSKVLAGGEGKAR